MSYVKKLGLTVQPDAWQEGRIFVDCYYQCPLALCRSRKIDILKDTSKEDDVYIPRSLSYQLPYPFWLLLEDIFNLGPWGEE